MDGIDRRRFLIQGGAAVAAAGVASALPVSAASALTKGRHRAEPAEVPPDASLGDPVVAHLSDVHTGEVTLFHGHREVKVKDKHLAALLYHATR